MSMSRRCSPPVRRVGPVDPAALEVLFSYPLGPAIALFSLLSAFFHLLIVSPWGWPRYSPS